MTATPYADDIKAAFTYPKVDTIVGKPTFLTVQKMESQETINAATVTIRFPLPHTNLTRIIKKPAAYVLRVEAAFPHSPYPGDALFFPQGETALQQPNITNVYNINLKNYLAYQRLVTAEGEAFTNVQLIKASEKLVVWTVRQRISNQNAIQTNTEAQQGYISHNAEEAPLLNEAMEKFSQASAEDSSAFTYLTDMNAFLHQETADVTAQNTEIQQHLVQLQEQMHLLNITQQLQQTRQPPYCKPPPQYIAPQALTIPSHYI